MAAVEAIAVAGASAAPMQLRDEAPLAPGVGIVGDRYATSSGTYSCLKEPGRQLTLISASGAREALAAAGIHNVEVASLRRNIILSGISAEALNATVGKTLLLGGAELFVHRLCVPCMYNERINRAEGLMCGLWHAGGVNCEVVVGGTVRVGDKLTIQDGPQRATNNGGKPAAFFKHPKQRSAEEARACIPQREAALRLAARDPVGAWRVQHAYESVGISFFAGGMPEGARPPRGLPSCLVLTTLSTAFVLVSMLLQMHWSS